MSGHFFKKFALTWWQAGLFKSSAIAFGIILGITFQELLTPLLPLMWIVFLVAGIWVVLIVSKQK
jgi:hypothetical protein